MSEEVDEINKFKPGDASKDMNDLFRITAMVNYNNLSFQGNLNQAQTKQYNFIRNLESFEVCAHNTALLISYLNTNTSEVDFNDDTVFALEGALIVLGVNYGAVMNMVPYNPVRWEVLALLSTVIFQFQAGIDFTLRNKFEDWDAENPVESLAKIESSIAFLKEEELNQQKKKEVKRYGIGNVSKTVSRMFSKKKPPTTKKTTLSSRLQVLKQEPKKQKRMLPFRIMRKTKVPALQPTEKSYLVSMAISVFASMDRRVGSPEEGLLHVEKVALQQMRYDLSREKSDVAKFVAMWISLGQVGKACAEESNKYYSRLGFTLKATPFKIHQKEENEELISSRERELNVQNVGAEMELSCTVVARVVYNYFSGTDERRMGRYEINRIREGEAKDEKHFLYYAVYLNLFSAHREKFMMRHLPLHHFEDYNHILGNVKENSAEITEYLAEIGIDTNEVLKRMKGMTFQGNNAFFLCVAAEVGKMEWKKQTEGIKNIELYRSYQRGRDPNRVDNL